MLRTPQKMSKTGKLSVPGHVASPLQKVNCGVHHGQDSCLLDVCGHLALETVSPNGQQPAFAAGKHGLILPSKYLKCSSKPLSSCLAESCLFCHQRGTVAFSVVACQDICPGEDGRDPGTLDNLFALRGCVRTKIRNVCGLWNLLVDTPDVGSLHTLVLLGKQKPPCSLDGSSP